MPLDYAALLADLEQESAWLLDAVGSLSAAEFGAPTPAVGWNIKDQILHLRFFDDATALALTDPPAFEREATELIALGADFPAEVARQLSSIPPSQALSEFSAARTSLQDLLIRHDPAARMPWYGTEMSVASAATARLMETWAHGQDIYDTLGLPHPLGGGLRSIAHLGVRTFGFAHRLRGLAVPETAVRVELTAPGSAEVWSWGPEEAADRVVGPALDFALVVTQRRHISATGLVTTGAVAAGWMQIAQAYAGAPGTGRQS